MEAEFLKPLMTMELTDLKRDAESVMQRLGKAQEYL